MTNCSASFFCTAIFSPNSVASSSFVCSAVVAIIVFVSVSFLWIIFAMFAHRLFVLRASLPMFLPTLAASSAFVSLAVLSISAFRLPGRLVDLRPRLLLRLGDLLRGGSLVVVDRLEDEAEHGSEEERDGVE